MNPVFVGVILSVYFLALLGVSYYTSRNANNQTFFIGNKNSNWLLVAFGMIGTSLSGVTFVSVPGTGGTGGFTYFQVVLGYFLGYFVVAFVLLPLYYKLKLTSIYTYLNERFGFNSYQTGAIFFIISRTLGATARLYLVINILDYKSHRNNIRDLFNDSTTLLSHLITTHTAETGTGYITTSPKEYLKMFKKASGGGIIVGALCVIKMLYAYVPGSEFYHAFLYSFNYAMGFIMIYLMNFTLATKQPAMTAATMAKVLSEGKNNSKNYLDFAHLVSKLFRSQFIAFVGNVLLSFPIALAIIYGLEILFGQNFAIEKSSTLLKDLDPFHSKALLHAALAGVYLFISGIIAGNVGNTSVFYKIPERIAKNPYIHYLFGRNFAENLSQYYSKNWAGIMSNLWLGIFLGSTATIGKFFGLDLDIRHITFAAGNFALGLYGKEFSIDTQTFIIAFVTVFLIGFLNFIVSFGLPMVLAFSYRKVNFGEVRNLNRSIIKYFFKNPLIFFFPIRSVLDERAKKLISDTTKHTHP